MVKINFTPFVYLSRMSHFLWDGILRFAVLRGEIVSSPMTITALENGQHSGTSGYDSSKTPPSNSFHYLGLAADIRSHDLSSQDKLHLLAKARADLETEGYKVLLEDAGEDNEHFHLQYGHFA